MQKFDIPQIVSAPELGPFSLEQLLFWQSKLCPDLQDQRLMTMRHQILRGSFFSVKKSESVSNLPLRPNRQSKRTRVHLDPLPCPPGKAMGKRLRNMTVSNN
jgi:hypothetical protein